MRPRRGNLAALLDANTAGATLCKDKGNTARQVHPTHAPTCPTDSEDAQGDEIIMKVLKRANRFYNTARFGQPEIRVYHKKGRSKKTPRYLLKCGCCEQKLEIYYAGDGLEIGGVNGAIDDWREILLPLLLIERKGAALVARKPKTQD